ncbi:acylphosphatase [[Haemophilus] felis]|uniref:acylphosphatase n=1 Tax=[Haemophilus] felis TaxID=123822 RepID=A0A1T0AV52_9PAST|nr:acylphosphatase [[Haemophilus] felis]NBI40879.1 acylphosphatase [[Haemophilus] felis]NBI43301.1 acylphosphatase [[Haemophilus] felis]OOS00503.1 acylphosphatase [[Haemophilus] felis]
MVNKQFFIYGRVQGVGFRFTTWREAQKLGLSGFVKNREDGSVEVVVRADLSTLEKLRSWLQVGPRAAKVNKIVEQDYKGEIQLTDFSIKH